MIAVLNWFDGFGNDTYVVGSFPNLEEARKACEPIKADTDTELRYEEFQFGLVEWNWYGATPLYQDENKKTDFYRG